jgi:hypothetical protein
LKLDHDAVVISLRKEVASKLLDALRSAIDSADTSVGLNTTDVTEGDQIYCAVRSIDAGTAIAVSRMNGPDIEVTIHRGTAERLAGLLAALVKPV